MRLLIVVHVGGAEIVVEKEDHIIVIGQGGASSALQNCRWISVLCSLLLCSVARSPDVSGALHLEF